MTKKQKLALAELIALTLRDGETNGKLRNPENPYPYMVGYFTGGMKSVIELLGFTLDTKTLTVIK